MPNVTPGRIPNTQGLDLLQQSIEMIRSLHAKGFAQQLSDDDTKRTGDEDVRDRAIAAAVQRAQGTG